MGEQRLDRDFSFHEYLSLEQADLDNRYEFVDGRVYAMSGGSIDHGAIISNIHFRIREQLEKAPGNCRAFTGEVKLAVDAANSYLYPDVFVVCGEVEEGSGYNHSVRNPTLIIEVLSRSTQAFDQSQKFRLYRMLPTLREYVLIDQYQPVIETFFKSTYVNWEIRTHTGLSELLELKSLGIILPINQIYQDISWA